MRPATISGQPALGWAISGVRATAAIWPITRSIRIGPVEQLAPITAAPRVLQRPHHLGGRGPALRAPVFLEAHLGDDRQVAGLAGGAQRHQHLVAGP